MTLRPVAPASLLLIALLAPSLLADPLPIQEFKLSNGMRVLALDRKAAPVVSSQLWYRVGSMHEPPAQTGLAHFLEHMMFKGTDRYKKGEIDKITQQLGGGNNASTSYDFTAYYFKFASDRWDRALEIEANRMKSCLFDPKEVESERKVVIEERQRDRDSPWGKLIEEVDAVTFTVHPYRHPVIGYLEDLQTLPRDAFVDFYKAYYVPNNATLVVVGDLRIDDLKDKAERALGKIATQPLPALPRLVEPPQECERRVVFREGASVTRGVVSYRAPARRSPDSTVLDVVAYVLGQGKTCRLYQRLVERERLASSVSVDNEARSAHNVFQIYVELLPSKDPARVESLILEEVARLDSEPVTARELEKARNQVSSKFIFDQETAQDLAYKIGQFDLQDTYTNLSTYVERVGKVAAGDVQRVARETFKPANRVVGWSLEGAPAGGTTGKPGDKGLRDRAGGRVFNRPAPGHGPQTTTRERKVPVTTGRPRPMKLDVQRFSLSNGLKVLVLPRQGLPVVALQATVQGDRRFDPEDRAGLAEFTGKMLQEGCEGKSSYDIASAIEAVGGTLESDDEGITAQGLSRDLPLLLDIVSGCLSTPTFPADRVAHIKAKTMAEIESDEDDPATVGSRAFHELVYEGHPYHHPSVGYKRTVQAITRDDLVAHHGRTYSPTGTLLAIVGEVDPLAIRSQVEKAFGRWKPREVSLAKVPAIERQAGPKLRAIFMDKEQLNIYLGHLGVRRSNPDYYSLQVMDNILGTSPGFADRMSRILRDEMGLAYHVRANITGTSGLEPGAFTAYIGTSPRNRRTSVEEMTRLIREICEVPVSPAELKDAKDYLTGSFVFKFETASQLASFLVDAERYQLGDDYLARYPELINEVSVADVTRVARQYLAPGAFSTVIVGPVDEKGELKAPAKK